MFLRVGKNLKLCLHLVDLLTKDAIVELNVLGRVNIRDAPHAAATRRAYLGLRILG
jgi:hypothetical protein